MPLMVTWSLGLVLSLAAMAQAQSEASKNTATPVPGPQSSNLIIGSEDPQDAKKMFFYPPHFQSQLRYFINPWHQDGGSGMALTPVDEAARTHLKLPKGQGLLATTVLPQGPAAQAGICENDILLTLDDAPLIKPEDVVERLRAAGDKALNLVVLHQGEKKTLRVQPQVKVTFGPAQRSLPEFWIGVQVTPVDPALRAQLQIPADQGLITNSVMDQGPAAKAGFKENDILLTMNGKRLLHQEGLATLVQQNGEKPVAVEIIREGSRKTIEVTPERRKGPNLLISKLQHAGDWTVVRPGAVLPDYTASFIATPEASWNPDLTKQGARSFDTWSSQPHADPLANRLDTMAGEIKELRKAVEELSKALKDRK